MASKPLHVRRLQKALQEWVQNPGELLFVKAFGIQYPSEFFLIDTCLVIIPQSPSESSQNIVHVIAAATDD